MTDPDDRPVLPEHTRDDTDAGWGERWDGDGDPDADPDERRLREERPPHHDRD